MLNIKKLTRLSLALPALLTASNVSAHSGSHAEVTMSQLIDHMLASSFHIGIVASVVITVAFVFHSLSKKKTEKANKL